MTEELPLFLTRCIRAFEWWNGSEDSDPQLLGLFSENPGNSDLATVLEKVSRVDKWGSTRITTQLPRDEMARHILSVRFPEPETALDIHLRAGDPNCVERIRKVKVTRRGLSKQGNLLSFASKYCHFSNPSGFAIYDSYADSALRALNSTLHFTKIWPEMEYTTQDYAIWLKDVLDLRQTVNPGMSLKELDQALWYLGAMMRESGPYLSAMVHRVRPVPAGLGISDDDHLWPCLLPGR